MKAKLVLETSAKGGDEIISLREELDKLKDGADQAGPELAELAAEINKLGAQQAAIEGFERLKAATTEAAARTQQLQKATRDAALALKDKQAALAAAAAAEQQASATLAQARAQQSAMGEAIKQLGAELKTMAKAATESGDASAVMAERLKDGEAQIAVLKGEYKAAAAGVAALAQAQRDNASAAKAAQRDVGAAQKEFDGLRQSAGQAKQALASQSQELQRSRDALAGMGISAKALADSQVGLNRGLDASRANLAALARKAEEAASVLANRELLGVRAHADVQKEIDKTRQAYEQLKASGKLTSTELAQAAMKVEERIRELHQQTNGWKESLGKAKMEFASMAASGAGLAVVAKKAIDFESAMADVAKVVNGTDEQMATLNGRIKEMTRTIPMAATELAAMAAAGGQLGIPLEKLEQFVELSAQMATAFNMNAEQAGEAVAKLSNVFSLPLEQVRSLGDAINALGNNMASKEKDIIDVLTRIGGTSKQFGLSAEQAAALSAAMLSLGVSSEVAGTGINAILSKLQTAGVQGKEFQLALAEAGVSAKQLAKDIRDNPQKAIESFLQTLSKLDGKKQAEVLSRLFGQEYQDDVARLLGGLDQYQKALGLVGDKAKTAGAMQQEFETRVKTTGAQLKLLKNAADEAGINLGTVFLPVINAVASGLKTATLWVADFAKAFPAISGVAASLVTAAASAGALGVAFGALRMAGTTAIAGLSALMPALTGGLVGAATAAGALKTAVAGLSVALGSFAVGWDIGTYLRNEFVEVERAGIAMAAGLTKAAAMAQTAWEMMRAPFTDDTVAAAQERLRAKLEQIDDEYAQLFASAGKAKAAVQEQGKAADAAAQANAKASEAVQAVTQKMKELGTGAQAAGQGAQQAAAALEKVFTEAIKGAKSVEVVAQLRDRLKEAQQAGLLAGDAAARLRVQLDQAGAAQGVKALVVEFHTLKSGTEGVQGAVDKLVESLKLDDKGSIAAFARALQELGSTGVLSAQQVAGAWQQALGKLNTQQLNDFSLSVKAAFAQGTLSAQEFAQANDQILSASFDRLGVNAAQALGKISTGAQEAINQVDLVAESAKAAGAGAKDAARAIEMAFAAAIPKADSLQAIDAMEQKLKAMGAAGQVSADGMGRLQSALDKQRATIEGQIPGIQSLGEALRQLGVKPQAELKELARTAKEAFDVVQASGTATPREINEAWKAMAEAAIAANDGIADATIQSQARQHGFVVETDKAGKSIVKSMKEAEDATKKVGDAAKDGADGMREMASAADDSRTALQKQAAAQNEAANEAVNAWMQAEQQADKYFVEMAKIARESGTWAKDVPKLAWAMSAALKELDAAQQSLERSNQGAAQGLEDLKMRLLELHGSEEDVAKARQARDEAEVRAKMALLRLDIERARIRKNNEEAERLTKELALLEEQLVVLGEIYREEEKQRKEREREEGGTGGGKTKGGGRSGGSGVSDGGGRTAEDTGGGGARGPVPGDMPQRPPVQITLHANGINDPVQLARLIEPELRRIAQLAR